MQRFGELQAVQAKVDARFAEVHARNSDRMRCGAGCHACCAPDLTVSAVEARFLAAHVTATAGLAERLADLERGRPHGDTRCRMLAGDGTCSVYEARPIVCRSHGMPIRITALPVAMTPLADGAPAAVAYDVCPLNFDGIDLAEVAAAGDVLDLALLNTLMFVVNQRFDPGDREGKRYPLTLAGVLGAVT